MMRDFKPWQTLFLSLLISGVYLIAHDAPWWGGLLLVFALLLLFDVHFTIVRAGS